MVCLFSNDHESNSGHDFDLKSTGGGLCVWLAEICVSGCLSRCRSFREEKVGGRESKGTSWMSHGSALDYKSMRAGPDNIQP